MFSLGVCLFMTVFFMFTDDGKEDIYDTRFGGDTFIFFLIWCLHLCTP